MISARRYVLSGLLAFVVTTLGGCVALQKSSTKEDDAPTDIRWFTDRMTDEGVIVRERGPAAFDLRSDEDVRMILDGTDLIDVYWFEDAAQAEQQAYELANSYPASRVYRRDGLVVVRYTDRAKGLSATLVSIMGARI
jgi:hypothetical protein